MIKGFVKTLSDQLTLLHHVETIRALSSSIESSRDASVQAALAELAKGAPPAQIIEQALYQFAQKMMHRPTKALRRAAQQQKLDVLDCAATLFTHEDLELKASLETKLTHLSARSREQLAKQLSDPLIIVIKSNFRRCPKSMHTLNRW